MAGPVSFEFRGFKEAENKLDDIALNTMSKIWDVIKEFTVKMVNQIKRNATSKPRVRSGLLRRSNTWKRIGAFAVRIFNPVEYASHQDEGTRFIKATFFFRAGINKFKGALQKAINKVLDDAAKD